MIFPGVREMANKLAATKPILEFKEPKGIENTRKAALRSFVVLWFWPYCWLLRYLEDEVYLKAYNADLGAYFSYLIITAPLGYIASLLIIHYLASTLQAKENFYRCVASLNWFSLWLLILMTPIALVQIWPFDGNDQLSRGVQIVLDNGWWIYTSLMTGIIVWRTLKTEFLTSMGIGVFSGIPFTVLNDFMMVKIFGVTRPFFE